MALKHLHELLREDQEPFQLKNYIADRRRQLKRSTPKNISIQPKKQSKSLIETSSKHGRLCKQACFFSFHDSPDVGKSPFPSPAKSPNTVFLHIPARTASLLLDAALKIQKQSSKPKSQSKNVGFGLFSTMLNRLRDKNKPKKCEVGINGFSVSLKESRITHRKSTTESKKGEDNLEGVIQKRAYEMGISSSCNNSRLSSAGWSESNEEKSLDLETCSSSMSDISEEIEIAALEKDGVAFASYENHFCFSPLSPFRFSLQRSPSPSPCRRTPDFSSPAASPSRHNKEESDNYKEVENTKKLQLEEEAEKDQRSPVSVLDHPFEDDDHGGDEEEEEDDPYDLECSYAIVQRTKQQLLHKLSRFERLAELDPIELEKRMLEEHYDHDEDEDEEFGKYNEASLPSQSKENFCEFVEEVLCKSSFCHLKKIPVDMKKLVLDLISEEKNSGLDNSNEMVVQKICKKLDSWKEVESNTINMMIESDIRKEVDGWNRHPEEARESAMEIELAIFGLLVEELSEELCSLAETQENLQKKVYVQSK